jgi:hypothetical protein
MSINEIERRRKEANKRCCSNVRRNKEVKMKEIKR